jgi:O-antigen ligase
MSRLISIALIAYVLLFAANYEGVFRAGLPNILILGVLVISWWVARPRWTWYATALDGVFILWGIAFVASLLANPDDARQIAIGLWYAALYIGVWYILHDLIVNGKLRRETLVDGVLVSGIPLVVTAIIEIFTSPAVSDGFFGFPRPVSLMGNPNTLATYLIVLIAFIGGRFYNMPNRWLLVLYGLISLFILFLTFSRGAWIGLGVAVVLIAALHRPSKWLVIGALIIGLIGGAVVLRSLNQSGRTLDLRAYIYDTAVQMFLDQPLTGHGLYTFGEGLLRAQIQHPDYPRSVHNHAHNIILHIAGELGLFGLLALAATAVMIFIAARRNWYHDRGMVIAGIAATTAYAVHHIFDVTSMLPTIALLGVIALVTAAAPLEQPQPRPARRYAVIVLWGLLLVTGLWSVNVYQRYRDVISTALTTRDFTTAAAAIQPIIDADPHMLPYHLQQGFFYALADHPAAIDSYRRAAALMPESPVIWANLAALYWQHGQQDEALQAIERGATLDPQAWQFSLLWGQYAETMGDENLARHAYRRMIDLYPATALHPALQASSDLSTGLDGLPLIASLYKQGDFETAARLWDSAPHPTAAGYAIRTLIALEIEGHDAARAWLEKITVEDEWSAFIEHRLKQGGFSHDTAYRQGALFVRAFYMRDMLEQVLIPQVGFTRTDPLLLFLSQQVE